jgi:hypothetical protein
VVSNSAEKIILVDPALLVRCEANILMNPYILVLSAAVHLSLVPQSVAGKTRAEKGGFLQGTG